MSATPGARNEYSRGFPSSSGDLGASEPPSGHRRRAFRPGRGDMPRGGLGLVMAGVGVGALLLIVAEFTPLYRVHPQSGGAVLQSVGTGSNHAYALIPIALLALFLGIAFRWAGARLALLGIGLAGVVALLIALVGDLPDARHRGVVGSAARGYVNAVSRPSAGLYMETLGAVVLIASCGSGLLLTGIRAPADA